MKSLSAALKLHPISVAIAVLLLQALCFHLFAQNEHEPKTLPLQLLSTDLGDWRTMSQEELETATAEILQPDDYLFRFETNDKLHTEASLFIAYFKSQRTGHAPHTPKNCLPGHGWTPSDMGTIQLPVSPGRTLQANYYTIAKGSEKSAVIYWYQTASRSVANEYIAKLFLIHDAIRHHRSDTALVRIIIPFSGSDSHSTEAAEAAAQDLAKLVYSALSDHFPGF